MALSFTNTPCIIVPPQIGAFEFTDNPINSGDMTSVICTVSKGDFPIQIVWMLNGRLITDYSGISVARTNKRISQLSIDSVQAEHSGDYVCIASNAAGNASHSTTLKVNGIILTTSVIVYALAFFLSF